MGVGVQSLEQVLLQLRTNPRQTGIKAELPPRLKTGDEACSSFIFGRLVLRGKDYNLRSTYVFLNHLWFLRPGGPAEPVRLGAAPAGPATRVHSQQLPLAAVFLSLAGLQEPGSPHVLVKRSQVGLWGGLM